MTSILHICADYPDAFSSRKTTAVRNLVQASGAFSHLVYAINRKNGLGGISMVDRTDEVTTLVYQAPAYGVLLETFLNGLAEWIATDLRERRARVDVVHAHKLTIEGLVASRLSTAIGCPYICTVRGNTDQKYFRLKPEKRGTFRKVASHSSHLLPVTPWVERYFRSRLKFDGIPLTVLPTMTGLERFLAPSEQGTRFATAFHLAGWRLKGMPNLLAAIALLRDRGSRIELDIIGGGSDATRAIAMRDIERRNLEDRVTLVGPVAHDEMLERFNGYAAFVLPTLRETFGMVYLEALFAGIPLLYSKGRGIDGYFDGQDIGVRCDPKSVSEIAAGLATLTSESAAMKESIRNLQQSGGLDRFKDAKVCATYAEIVESVTQPT